MQKLVYLGFEVIKDLNEYDEYFGEVWKVCKEIIDYQDNLFGLLLGRCIFFKGKQLCIPKLSKRNSLIKEWHGPALS